MRVVAGFQYLDDLIENGERDGLLDRLHDRPGHASDDSVDEALSEGPTDGSVKPDDHDDEPQQTETA